MPILLIVSTEITEVLETIWGSSFTILVIYSRCLAFNFLESLTSETNFFGKVENGLIRTPFVTRGPAKGPRPTSSSPIIKGIFCFQYFVSQ